jgi:hypothetical protein
VFSFGCVLYEMLTGRRPFAGNSDVALVTAILRDDPPPLRTLRADVPAAVTAIVSRALAKRPDARYADANAMLEDLSSAREALGRRREVTWRRSGILVPAALALVAAAAFGGWQVIQANRLEEVRERDIPEIERLQFTDESLRAVALAARAERIAPSDIRRVRAAWYPFDTSTDPEGAEVFVRNYVDLSG